MEIFDKMIRQPRLPDPVAVEAYALMQRRYEPTKHLEAIASKPYEPISKTSSFREAISQAYSRAVGYSQRQPIHVRASYLDEKLIPVVARIKDGADYLKTKLGELSDRIYSIEMNYLRLTRYSLSSHKGSLEVGDPKRLAFLVAIIVMLGAAGYVWYPRLFSKRPPVRIEQASPPLLIETPVKPAEPSTFYGKMPSRPAKPAPTYPQMPTPRKQTPPRKAETVKPAPKPPVGEIFTHEIATEPETIIPR